MFQYDVLSAIWQDFENGAKWFCVMKVYSVLKMNVN